MFNRVLGSFGVARRTIVISALILLLIAVTTRHIGSVPAGLGPSEQAAISQSAGIHQIIDRPLNAPHNLILFLSHRINHPRLGWIRLSSYIYACLFFGCIYYLARGWFGKTIGILSTL